MTDSRKRTSPALLWVRSTLQKVIFYFNSFKTIFRVALCIFFFASFDTSLVLLGTISTLWRVFCVHGGGHRYFAHKSFRCTAWLEFLMAVTISFTDLNQMHYWSVLHNIHHTNCDGNEDFHSPVKKGFWPVQLTYFLLDYDETARVADVFVKDADKKLASSYENNLSWITPPVNILMVVCDNLFFLLLGYFLPSWTTVQVWCCLSLAPRLYTNVVANLTNSAGHTFGSRPYRLKGARMDCHATNCWWAALLGGGEGWHNNHHAFALSSRHGFFWYEVDVVFYFLCILGYFGVVWNMLVISDEVKLAPPDSDFRTFDQKYVLWFKR